MSLSLILSFIVTFFLGNASVSYSLSSWGVKPNVAIAVGAVFGILAAIFATLTVSPLLGA